MAYEFYKTIAYKKYAVMMPMPAKTFTVNGNTAIKTLLYQLNWENYYLFYIVRDGAVYKTVTEQKLIQYVLENGLCGVADEI
jgi:hypothetical protein